MQSLVSLLVATLVSIAENHTLGGIGIGTRFNYNCFNNGINNGFYSEIRLEPINRGTINGYGERLALGS